jgi:hypothetical protein
VNTTNPVVEEKMSNETSAESCTEDALVELGVVSKDTRGGWGALPDGGLFRQF